MSSDPELRLPPFNREAEQSVLGSMLRDNRIIDDVTIILGNEDLFYTDAHRKLFRGILELHNNSQPVDVVTLAEWLNQQKFIEDIGGYVYLKTLLDVAPSAANAEYYAKIVRDKGILRSLIHAGSEIARDAYDQAEGADELLGAAERKILSIAQMGSTAQTIPLRDALQEAYERLDARTKKEDLTLAGVPSGFIDLDEKMGGFQASELIIIAARPAVGKCLAHDAEIVRADGRIATIEELFHQQAAQLLTLQDDYRFNWTTPSNYIDDGIKPVYRVTTRLGRRVDATLSHPFLTLEGWRSLGSLTPGEQIAVPRRLDVFGAQPMLECRIKLLAYLIGDGGLSDTTPEFTNCNERLREEFTQAVQEFGGLRVRLDDGKGLRTPTLCVASDWEMLRQRRGDFGTRLRQILARQRLSDSRLAQELEVSPALVALWKQGRCAPSLVAFQGLCATLAVAPEDLAPAGCLALSKNSKNALTRWLEELGLWGQKAQGKIIPPCIFQLPRQQLALFLNRLFATDGWATVVTAGAPQIGYTTVNERLARQIQHLLLRFGIIAALRQRKINYREGRVAWQLDVTDQDSLRTFLAQIDIFGKEDACARVAAALHGRTAHTNADLLPRSIWNRIAESKGEESWRSLGLRLGLGASNNLHPGARQISRRRLGQLATALQDDSLRKLAESEVYWDRIESIEYLGPRQVYDLTIPETHNFVANDICVHNTAFALGLCRHAAVEAQLPVFFVSLEMSRVELAERLLVAQSRVEGHKLRKGTIDGEDANRIFAAGDVLGRAKLFIDDTPAQNMLRIAANARRLKRNHNIALVCIDYLQLIDTDNKRESRQEQVAAVSRRLKVLARELKIPVVALAQLNRGSEDRGDHRPRVSDLRESGCLTGDTLVTLAETGTRVPIRELVDKAGFDVWALDEVSMKLKPATVNRAFSTGRKPVYRLNTKLGRTIRATGNHQFRTIQDWRRLDELKPGDRVALPRQMPGVNSSSMTAAELGLLGHLLGDGCTLPRHAIQYTTREPDLAEVVTRLAQEVFGETIVPRTVKERNWLQVYLAASERLTHGRRNPVAAWLEELGVFGLRSWEKKVPALVFQQSTPLVATFLRHLWATDGCIRPPENGRRHPAIYYASSSEPLARDVHSLLLRAGINGVLRSRSQGTKGRTQFHVLVMGKGDILNFANQVGAVGQYKSSALLSCSDWVKDRTACTNRDVIPASVWRTLAVPAMQRNGVTMRQMQKTLGMQFAGSALYRSNISRERLERVAVAVGGDPWLTTLAQSDVYWDEILSITPDGEEEVYDLTVPGPANFVANDIIVHNSIEQDADAVLLLHRPEIHEPGQHEGVVELIIGKQRNGPTGEITLTYLKQFMRFENFAVEPPFSYGN